MDQNIRNLIKCNIWLQWETRYERPQSGRSRQFHQLGVEVPGSTNPATDVETIAMAWDLLKELDYQICA